MTRPHGLLHPPQNPFLREDMKPRTQSRFWNSGWNGGRGKQLGSPPKKKAETLAEAPPEAAEVKMKVKVAAG